jgi:YHS domain-containing protein
MIANSIKQPFVDPVCQMKVSGSNKTPTFTFRSGTYHFCADTCRSAFMADPLKYMEPKPKKRKGLWARYLERLNKATGGKPPCCH